MSQGSVVIAGAGIFGVAASLALRARGVAVTVLDPGPIPRPEAASNDISKVVRMDYDADRFYTEMMEEAFPRWRAWNARWGETLYHEDGFLLLSRHPLDDRSFEGASLATMRSRGHAVERLDRSAIGSRFPAWREGGYADGYFNPTAGWVESGRALARLIEDARAAGVTFRIGERLDRPAPGRVVIAAGAWTPGLVPALARVMRAVAQPVFHLSPGDPDLWRGTSFPVWAADIARTGWYGFPANRDGIVKVACHGPGRAIDPDQPRSTRPEDEHALRTFLRESLPGLADAPLAAAKTCFYCDTFDGDFWIDRDPGNPDVVVAAGDSGHALKFAPVLGELIADVVLGIPNRYAPRFARRDPGPRTTEAARFDLT